MVRGWISSIAADGRRLARATRGAVAVMGALSLTTLVGMGAFAVEIGRGYAADTENQRIADMAALAGALAYNVNSNSSEMTASARAVVVAQGLPSSAAAVALVTDAATSKQLVQVTVTTSVPLALGRVFSSALSYDVSAVGAATTTATATTAPPCIAALSPSPTYGVTLSGGVAINSPGCAINTNAGVTVPWGTYITAKQVTAGGGISNPGSGITTSPTANNIAANKANAAADWMKEDVGLKAMLCGINKLTSWSDDDYVDHNTACLNPLVTPVSYSAAGYEDWTLGYRAKSDGGIHAYQTGNYSCKYAIPAGTYYIGRLTVPGGCEISFANGSTLWFDSVDMSGNAMTVGNGDVTVAGSFGFNSGSVITFGNGNHSFGSLYVSGGRQLNIGSGNLNVTGGIRIDGGSYIRVALGVGNTVTLGDTGGNAINVGGGSFLCFTQNCSAPTVAAGTFSANGHVVSSGGSTIIFPKAASHVLNGNLSLNGSSTFGSGIYSIAGNFTNNTGGTMSGSDVSFALGGTFTLSGGTSLDLAAPNSAAGYGVPGILIATKSSAATSIGGGSQNKYAGLVYAPRSDLSLTGGASMSSYGTNCLMMILKTLYLSGGTTVASACSSLSGSSSSVASVALFK